MTASDDLSSPSRLDETYSVQCVWMKGDVCNTEEGSMYVGEGSSCPAPLTILDHLSLRCFIEHHLPRRSPGVHRQGIGSSAPQPGLEEDEDDSEPEDDIEPHGC